MRLAIAFGFLSAVADRLGLWPEEISAWGNWESFLEYTQLINPLRIENRIDGKTEWLPYAIFCISNYIFYWNKRCF